MAIVKSAARENIQYQPVYNILKVNLNLSVYWNVALRVGITPDNDYAQQMRLFTLKTFLFVSTAILMPFVLAAVSLGKYSALEGLFFLSLFISVFYLNSIGYFKTTRVLAIYVMMLLTLALALADKRTGREYNDSHWLLLCIGF
jgi:hypothetical protein